MRRILITPAIEALAKRYANGMMKGKNLTAKPKDNLKTLKSVLISKSTTFVFKKKKVSTKTGRKKSIFRGNEVPEYAAYIEDIIKRYPVLNNLHPREFDNLKKTMESNHPDVDLSVVVRIGAKGKTMSFANHIVKAMDYDGVRDNVFREYMQDPAIGIKACVYCNAQYALTTLLEPALTLAKIRKITGRGRRPNPHPARYGATYELDHNLPKDEYPYLCTNFYNLQPCCGPCNRHKNDNAVNFSVYYWDKEDPKPLHFELAAKDIIKFRQKNKCDGLKPILKSSTADTSLVDAFNKAFSIDAVYSLHTDEVQELLWRHKIYSATGVDALRASFSHLFADGFDADRFILGTYISEADAHKRPLTIMKQDIIKQIKDEEARGSKIGGYGK